MIPLFVQFVSPYRIRQNPLPGSCPFERTLAPCVVISDYKYTDENQHFDQSEQRKPVIYDCPWKQEDSLDVKDEKKHRDHIEPYREPLAGVSDGIDPALIGHQFVTIEHPALQQ